MQYLISLLFAFFEKEVNTLMNWGRNIMMVSVKNNYNDCVIKYFLIILFNTKKTCKILKSYRFYI